MKKCLIIGKPNVGKTLFLVNFADYLGYKNINIQFKNNNKTIEKNTYEIQDAKHLLSSNIPFKTTTLQSIVVDMPVLKGKKTMELMDSSGLTDGVHNNVNIRRAMAQTLGAIKECDIIFHMIDVSNLDSKQISSIGEVDNQLVQYGQTKDGYVILANKIDLIENKSPILELQKKFPNTYIIPVSSLNRQGFSEVKSYVSHRL